MCIWMSFSAAQYRKKTRIVIFLPDNWNSSISRMINHWKIIGVILQGTPFNQMTKVDCALFDKKIKKDCD